MADGSLISISTPVAQIVDASSRAFAAVMEYSSQVRTSESQASRDEEDRIRFQAYWDFRAVLQFCKLVGPPEPWPPPAIPQPPAPAEKP